MNSNSSSGIVVASVWLALLLYPFGLAGLRPGLSRGRARLARWLFSLGALLFTVHAISAFFVHYELSHTVALRDTARQTLELTGIESGAGLYLNYLFALLWWIEAVWWQTSPKTYRSRPPALSAVVHGFFLFMIVNGGVVFVAWPRRALGFVVLALCGYALWFRTRQPEAESVAP